MADRNGSLQNWLNRIWYGQSRWYRPLLPFSWLYGVITKFRRRLYRKGILRTHDVPVPVVVIGNITAGGTGKTPLTIWLADQLQRHGWRPGVVTRGYGAKPGRVPVQVSDDSNVKVVGDEALLMAKRLNCPVFVHPDRVAAARAVAEFGSDVVIADDGLQHYRLRRDYEVAVIDGGRAFGNGKLLPAGPLREPIARLDAVDKVLVQRERGDGRVLRRKADRAEIDFRLVPIGACSLHTDETVDLQRFDGETVHAVAGIGNPDRFFRMLEAHGLQVIEHPLPDHASISQADISFYDNLDVVLTEKDAVKCRQLDTERCWYVPVAVEFGEARESFLIESLHSELRNAAARKTI